MLVNNIGGLPGPLPHGSDLGRLYHWLLARQLNVSADDNRHKRR